MLIERVRHLSGFLLLLVLLCSTVLISSAQDSTPEVTEGIAIELQLVTEGLTSPVALLSDGSGRLFVVDQTGVIYILAADGQPLEEPFLDLSDWLVELTPDYDERGLLGMAFHPEYASNGRFFVYYSAPLRDGAPEGWDHTNVVAEFSVSDDDPNVADPDSERIILEIDQPQYNHNGGQILFGPDGYLYIPIGDGGGANDTDMGHTPELGNGQDTTNLHGSILRIDVDNGDPYGIPDDNPFVGDDEAAEEIYAYGLRNPFRISFDPETGDLYAADAGQELYEEVSIITAGGNYGWNIMEGTSCFNPDEPEEPLDECDTEGANGEALIDPIIEHDHSYGIAIIGGYVYRGTALFPTLTGAYIFGDYALSEDQSGAPLYAAIPPYDGDVMWDIVPLRVTNTESGLIDGYLLSFGRDDAGELYVLTTENLGPTGNTGRVWRIALAGGEGTPAPTGTITPLPTSAVTATVMLTPTITATKIEVPTLTPSPVPPTATPAPPTVAPPTETPVPTATP